MSTRVLLTAVAVAAAWGVVRAVVEGVLRRVPGVPVAGIPRPIGAGLPRRMLARIGRRRSGRRFDEGLPDAVAAIARSLRSGASLRQALAEAAAAAPPPVGPALHDVVAATWAGLPLTAALQAWSRRCPRPDVLLLVTALTVAHETGGASAQAVDGVAATLRRRRAARAEAVALATQARTSAYVLAGLPVALCLFALLAGGSTARFLLGTPLGLACLGLGLALEVVGAWWMLRLTAWCTP